MTKTKVNYAEYELIHYFDVWGNNIDGYEVNDLCNMTDKFGTIIISEEACDEEIIDFLIEIGYFTSEAKDSVEIEWNDDTLIEFSSWNGCPLCRLVKIRDIK